MRIGDATCMIAGARPLLVDVDLEPNIDFPQPHVPDLAELIKVTGDEVIPSIGVQVDASFVVDFELNNLWPKQLLPPPTKIKIGVN